MKAFESIVDIEVYSLSIFS